MSKRNKLRYQSKGNVFPTILMTGRIFLKHVDDQTVIAPEKGDLLVFLSTDSSPYNPNVGNYETTGLDGYLKADVFDGKGWKPLSLEELFDNREYYFSKRERPIDSYHFCLAILEGHKGTELERTYREHYVKCSG